MNKCLYCDKSVKNKYCSVSCQNKHQSKEKYNKIYGSYKEFEVICGSCNSSFFVKEREKLYPQKEKYFCSKSCSNKRIFNNIVKEKIRNSLTIYGDVKCLQCNFEFKKKKKDQKFCSRFCASKYRNKKQPIGSYARKAGLISASRNVKRSKNEIYFADLCELYFKDVETNKNIFNGWDADVIIYDIKVAVLWNGIWHYKKISKNHSLKQVQNRDRIKLNEIENCGFNVHIIKDMGRHNKIFVEENFKDFLRKYCGVEKLVSHLSHKQESIES